MIDYIIHLREELGLSASTTNNRVAEVKKFYDTNDIELRWKKIKSYTGRRKNRRSKKKTGLTPILKSSTFTITRRRDNYKRYILKYISYRLFSISILVWQKS